MEHKKLLNILRKDMSELEELIADVKSQGKFDALEMEFIHTRAKGVMQLVHLLNISEEVNEQVMPVESEKIEQIRETVAEIQEKVIEHKQKEPEVKEEEETKPEAPKITDSASIHQERVEEQKKGTDEQLEDKKQVPAADYSENEEDMLDDETETSEPSGRLGDSFLKGKSLNDLATGKNKLEFKISNRPVNSIKSAIGINDRFQYIRELFDGDPEKFNETVDSLDSMNNIRDAVVFLRQNFRWKKTETSLKFVNLVKRRFQNEK